MLPDMQALDGFCSASLLVDRGTDRACSTTRSSPARLAASRGTALGDPRDAGIREAGVDVLDVLECDLVLAHLRLPELV